MVQNVRRKLGLLPSPSAAAALADSAHDAAFATTLAKGLVVLEAFKAGATRLGNMELSASKGITRPTVARLTHTLAELGYLIYDRDLAKYRVGVRALRMAHPLLADMPFRQVARPLMQEVAQSLRGTVSIGADATETALTKRLAELPPLADPVILHDVKPGTKTRRHTVRMDFDQNMGALYPFSLRDKLARITETSWLYEPARAGQSPWGRAIIPFEMLSVLFQYSSKEDKLPVRGPAVGLFADQEIRLLDGPLFVGENYDLEREVVALSGSRLTESLWMRATVFARGTEHQVAIMLINLATLKES
jgi:hypothetical protein